MLAFRPGIPLLFFSLFLAAGCGPNKLNETVNWPVDDNTQAKGLELQSQSKPQQITVDFSSTSEVSVYLFKKDDCKGEDDFTTADTKKALGNLKNSKGGNFTAEVPANTACWVVVRTGGRKTDVKLTVKN